MVKGMVRMENVKAITIKQPWATLIALGEKQFETRTWQTPHRGKLAIHAGKKIDVDACNDKDISKALTKHGLTKKDLPLGAVVAIANLTDIHKVLEDYGDSAKTTGEMITTEQYLYGDYSEGRYAWKVEAVEVLPQPIQAKGKLSLWIWERD